MSRRRFCLWRALPAILILAAIYAVLKDGAAWADAVARFVQFTS